LAYATIEIGEVPTVTRRRGGTAYAAATAAGDLARRRRRGEGHFAAAWVTALVTLSHGREGTTYAALELPSQVTFTQGVEGTAYAAVSLPTDTSMSHTREGTAYAAVSLPSTRRVTRRREDTVHAAASWRPYESCDCCETGLPEEMWLVLDATSGGIDCRVPFEQILTDPEYGPGGMNAFIVHFVYSEGEGCWVGSLNEIDGCQVAADFKLRCLRNYFEWGDLCLAEIEHWSDGDLYETVYFYDPCGEWPDNQSVNIIHIPRLEVGLDWFYVPFLYTSPPPPPPRGDHYAAVSVPSEVGRRVVRSSTIYAAANVPGLASRSIRRGDTIYAAATSDNFTLSGRICINGAGFGDDTCNECDVLNDTFQIQSVGGDYGTSSTFEMCGKTYLWQLDLSPSDGWTFCFLYCVDDDEIVALWSLLGWDYLSDVVLDLEFDIVPCTLPLTLTLTTGSC
jgi:hypothetical protein